MCGAQAHSHFLRTERQRDWNPRRDWNHPRDWNPHSHRHRDRAAGYFCLCRPGESRTRFPSPGATVLRSRRQAGSPRVLAMPRCL